MAEEFAKRLAATLLDENAENPVVVDLPNDDFSERVARYLREMGCEVEFDTSGRRLTVYRQGSR